MKILIADSGSTKTTWALIKGKGRGERGEDYNALAKSLSPLPSPLSLLYTTEGLNPLYTSSAQIEAALLEVLSTLDERHVDALYFYGAGCSDERVAFVEDALRKVVTPDTHIEVSSDLLGACRALGTEICCIIGTGSIAALYDAETEEMGVASSLGYILGDEGSGVWLGRQVLSDYLKNQMPAKAREAFEEEFGEISAESAIAHVYQSQRPNRYLAQFATFVGNHLDKNYCHKLAFEGIELFFKRNIMRLQPEPTDRISFVGSVAYNLQEIIKQVAALYGLQTGIFLKEPIEGLIEFHKNHVS